MKKRFLPFFTILSVFTISAQQTINEPVFNKSPELTSEGELIFTIKAPLANEVKLSGSIPATKLKSSLKDNEGLWKFIYDSPEPDLYDYWFEIDGVKTLDPTYPYVARDIASLSNIFIIPGEASNYYLSTDVPHGKVEKVWYDSDILGANRRMTIYTPAGYEKEDRSYPVLYLLHGMGGDEEAWQDLGRVVQILDNMIATGKAVPMIVVMPNGNAERVSAPGFNGMGMYVAEGNHSADPERKFEKSFPEIMEYVENNYRTVPDKSHRAIAGLSMGGGHAWRISMNQPENFDYVGLFSPAVRWNGSGVEEGEVAPELLESLNLQFNNPPKKYKIYIGKDDFLYGMNESYRKILDQEGYPYEYMESDGGHTWTNWRKYLVDFLPGLF